MRIITHTCSSCGTIVSANELESNRVMNCPGLRCEAVLQFDDLPEEAREAYLRERSRYQI